MKDMPRTLGPGIVLVARLVAGAGHSIAEEQPEEVNRLLMGFLSTSDH
jgi:pimeloyl-ACP methyl ester carboxylesterase